MPDLVRTRRGGALTGWMKMSAFNLKSALKNGAAYLEDVYGGAAIIMALMTPIIIGGLAFGAEVGGWELTKRQVQNAADTAAYAAATQVRSGYDNDTITAAALVVATDSGYKGGSDGLALEYPPSTAPNAVDGTDPNGDSSYVYVTLAQSEPRRFTKFFASGSDAITISSSALAKVENGRPACVLALDPSASGAISVGGSADVTLTGCDVASNSVSSSAVLTNGGAADLSTNCVSSVGGVSDGGGVIDLTECPEAIENAPVTADPYKDVAEPPACGSYQNVNTFTSGGNPKNHNTTGCWGGAAQSNLSITKTINLNASGTYVFKNVNINLSGNGVINGTHVTIYLEGTSSITVNGNATMNITAPVSGTYSGLAIFGDRDSAGELDLSGNSGVAIVGAVYSPNSDITFIGNSSGFAAGQCTQIIGGTVAFTGDADFDLDCSASGTTSIVTAQSIKIVG